ncbi:MAG: APC family permease [Actinomycetota bacterium]
MASPQGGSAGGGLKRDAIGLPGLIAQSLGVTAPEISGVVIASVVALYAGVATPLALLVGGLGAIALGLIYSRFARYVPHAGGTYAIVRAGLGADVGYFAGWVLLAVGMIFVAGLIIASAFLLQALSGPDLLNIKLLGDQWVWTAIVLAAIVFVISYLGVSLSAKILLTITAIGVALLTVFAIVILAKGGANGLAWTTFNPSHISDVGFSNFAIAVGISMTMFSGFETAVFLAEETHTPRKQVPKAVIGAVVAALVFFLFMAFSIITGYGTKSASQSWGADGPFAVVTLSAEYWKLGVGQLLLGILALSSAISALGTANFTTRVAFSWGRDGYLPKAFARTHPRHQTPHVAIGVLAIVTLAIFAAGSAWKGQSLGTFAGFTVFSWLLLAGAAGILPVYALVGISGARHSMRTGGSALDSLVAPVVAVVIVGAAEFTQFYNQSGANKNAPFFMMAWMVLGILVRVATRGRVRSHETEFDAAPAEAGLQSPDAVIG